MMRKQARKIPSVYFPLAGSLARSTGSSRLNPTPPALLCLPRLTCHRKSPTQLSCQSVYRARSLPSPTRFLAVSGRNRPNPRERNGPDDDERVEDPGVAAAPVGHGPAGDGADAGPQVERHAHRPQHEIMVDSIRGAYFINRKPSAYQGNVPSLCR
ncbi:hypothetical protein SAMD00023353_10600170 [Rosellinia necatrix]|uniref:Uncharacterized protein n=1 Tax=Rosellinia necatrix TaxID=77044 RepID=A0A1S8AB95_ROSNE|nr:hypothetical protein SAMD00023353_10600170 [Rosellinia necatrix]